MATLTLRLGIFGGTFDPPHIGHLILASEALDQLELDRILWVLTPFPPHKTEIEITPLDIRLQMINASIEGNPNFLLSEVDIRRPPPHYAIDTIELIRKENPGAELIYLMGSDSLMDLPFWHNPVLFVEEVDYIGVMCRPGVAINLSEIEQEIPGLPAKVQFFCGPEIGISSSDIRRRIIENRPYRYFVPEAVYRVILENHIYDERINM